MQQLIVKSLTGQHFTAKAVIDRNRRINGERDITLSFLCNEINSEFIKDIETGWKINFQGDWYHLFNEKTDIHGNKSFSGVLDFYFHMNGFWHMDEVENKSMTVQESVLPLFYDTDYVIQIIDNFYSNTMSYSKQQNTTERFSYFVDRFNAEYNIPIGTKTVQLRNKIGVTRNDVIIHEDDNLEDLSIDIDSSSFCTAIKGYYNFQKPKDAKDGEEAVPTQEYPYISPMAEKYGEIWGEPIYDERFNNLESIKAACKEKQESSYKISYSIKKSLLGNTLNEGDYVRFIAPSYNINTYVRVVDLKEQFDDDLDLIDAEYTFGNENIATAFSKMQYEAVRDLADIMRGKKPIPPSVLPKAVREATAIINAGSTTQFYYREDGIYGYNTENPLGVTRYNANGIGFSQDGGETFSNAMTYLGIVADAITTGTMSANRIAGGMLKSLSDSMIWDLNNNRFDFYENSKILFHSPENGIIQELNGTTAFLNFMPSLASKYPGIVLGTSDVGLNSGNSTFVGFKAQTAKATPLGLSQAEILGDRIVFDGDGSENTTGSWILETNRKDGKLRGFYGIDQDKGYTYELGRPSNRFEAIHTERLGEKIRVVLYGDGTGVLLSPNLKNGIKFSDSGLELITDGANYKLSDLIEKINGTT